MLYSYFIAVPMSAIPTEQYNHYKSFLQDLAPRLAEATGKPVFCDMLNVEPDTFYSPQKAFSEETAALRQSDNFVLLFPHGTKNSGVIFEAGFAAALGKPSLYFVQEKSDLPYMLREADLPLAALVKIRLYKDVSDIAVNLLARHPLAGAARGAQR